MKGIQYRADGWVPHRLVHARDKRPQELISYPYQEENDDSVMVQARQTPGDPTTAQAVNIEELRQLKVECPKCHKKWVPKVKGEYRDTVIACDNCHREYFADYDNGKFVGFAFHGEALILKPSRFPKQQEKQGG